VYKLEDIRRLEIEPTNTCQARCPQCLRTPTDGSVNKTLNNELTLDLLKERIPASFWANLTSINFNGSTGDCMAHKSIRNLVEYMKLHSTAPIVMHTNGGLGSTSTWTDLAMLLGPEDKVIFGIDGLADTSPLYRIGVDFDLAVKNAQTFILAGGYAEWQYIVFKHNQHQVEEARQLSRDLGFAHFWLRSSGRFTNSGYQDVYANGVVTHRLEPADIKLNFVEAELEYKKNISTTAIDCEAINTKWISIYADGTVWPCCHLMGWHRAHDFSISNLVNKKLNDVIGDYKKINLHYNDLKDIINSDVFQVKYPENFASNQPNPICVSNCRRCE